MRTFKIQIERRIEKVEEGNFNAIFKLEKTLEGQGLN
jgi:hypothetical protein